MISALPFYQVDSFTNALFKGNPAGVVLCESPLDASTMLNIAAENNLAETAFLIKINTGWNIRFFTPRAEINLCGHATLASAHVIFHELQEKAEVLTFNTHDAGSLNITQRDGWYIMDFPVWPAPSITPPPVLLEALHLTPHDVYFAGKVRDYLLVLKSEAAVAGLNPDYHKLATLPDFVCVTAPSGHGHVVDFVSRFFTPQDGINEDPVTGSSHCMLIPYWSDRLGKKKMLAHQISQRGGVLQCAMLDGRVEIGGQARTYLKGHIALPD